MSFSLILELSVLLVIMIIQVIIPPIPAELIVIEGGRRLGVPLTTASAGTGLLIGSIAVYYFGRYLSRRFNRFFSHDRTRLVIQRLKDHENILLWVRVLPYNPSDLISYAAGVMRLDARKFALNTVCIAYLRTLVLAVLGTRLSDAKAVFQVIFILFASWVIATVLSYGRRKS